MIGKHFIIAILFTSSFLFAQQDSTSITLTTNWKYNKVNCKVDSVYRINWQSKLVDSIKIEYSTDGAKNWLTIEDKYPADSGFYDWRIPNTPSIYCKLKISDYQNDSINDISPKEYDDGILLTQWYFTIYGENKWTKVNSPTEQDLQDIKFLNSNEVIAWNNEILIYSNDAGNQWEILSEFNSSTATFVNKFEGWKVINHYEQKDNSAIFFTNDGGFSWTQISSIVKILEHDKSSFVSDISFYNKKLGSLTLYYGNSRLGLNSEIYSTNDSGKTWQFKYSYSDNSKIHSIKMFTPEVFASSLSSSEYQLSPRPLYIYTLDGGNNWFDLPKLTFRFPRINFEEEKHLSFSSWFIDENSGWSLSYYGSGWFYINYLNVYKDNIWTNVYNSIYKGPRKLYFVDKNNGWFYGDQNINDYFHSGGRHQFICATFDGGLTWEVQQFDSLSEINSFAAFNNSYCIAVGKGGAIYKSNQIIVDINNTEIDNNIVKDYTLSQNYPNPFNPTTKINFTLPEQGNVSVTVYNSIGEVVTKLIDENLKAGKHNVLFNGENLASGIYFYRIKTNNYIKTKKMILLK